MKYEIQKYKQKDFYPEVTTITDVAKLKCPSLRDIETKNKTSRKELRQIVALTITQYVFDDLLPLTPAHLNIISDWIVSDYNPETQQGGAMGYSIEDIHIIFRMGISGQFGKPSGHKYILPEIIGSNGWFEQYENLRNIELSAYYQKLNYIKATKTTPPSSEDIPPPDNIKIDYSKVLKNKRKKYKSIHEFCNDKEYNYAEVMKPYFDKWKVDYVERKIKHYSLEDWYSFNKITMLKRINNAPIGKKKAGKDKMIYPQTDQNPKIKISKAKSDKIIKSIIPEYNPETKDKSKILK